MDPWLILILAFLLICVHDGFARYTRKKTSSLKIKNQWAYAWTGEALLFGTLAVLFRIFTIEVNPLNLFAGTLLYLSGFGLMVSVALRMIEKDIRFWKIFNFWSLLQLIYHGIMGVIGIWLIMTTHSSFLDLGIALLFLFLYAAFMIPEGLEVPWILYKKSFLSMRTRKRIISTIIVVTFALLSFLSLLS